MNTITPKVGMVAEWCSGSKMKVMAVDNNRKTFDIWYDDGSPAPSRSGVYAKLNFYDRPWSELVPMGDNILWNHDFQEKPLGQ